jgi:hypothetical protein
MLRRPISSIRKQAIGLTASARREARRVVGGDSGCSDEALSFAAKLVW